jgi:hypothetical protein
MKVKSANGCEGVLIYCGDDNFRIRVYHEDNSFTDYDILHNDLVFTINDSDAYFYEDEVGRCWIDHSPETLGMEKT